jgi:cytochrome c oxidase subunit 3
LSEQSPTSTALAHQFDDLHQQKEASTLGMWLFLVTEIMFFGGMFTGYVVYRNKYYDAFVAGSHANDIVWGATNTVVLIWSSLTMALAVHAAQLGKRKALVICLALTILFGSVFLGIKGIEYHHKFVENHVPGPSFEFHSEPGKPAVNPANVQLFYSFYFAMTGMHAVHMVVGIGILSLLVWMAWRNRFSPEYYAPVEMTGLYWHFVDVVWIFLFALLYLIGRHG